MASEEGAERALEVGGAGEFAHRYPAWVRALRIVAMVAGLVLSSCARADPAPPASPPDSCENALLPVAVGNTWTYLTNYDGTKSYLTDSITDVGPDSFVLHSTVRRDLGKGEPWHESEATWLCRESGLVRPPSLPSGSSQEDTTLTFEGALLPRHIEDGQTWSYSVRNTSSEGAVQLSGRAHATEASVEGPDGADEGFDIATHLSQSLSFTDQGRSIDSTYEVEDSYGAGVGLVTSRSEFDDGTVLTMDLVEFTEGEAKT